MSRQESATCEHIFIMVARKKARTKRIWYKCAKCKRIYWAGRHQGSDKKHPEWKLWEELLRSVGYEG